MEAIAALLAIIGLLAGWLLRQGRITRLEAELARVRTEAELLRSQVDERSGMLTAVREQLATQFAQLAGSAIRENAAELARQHQERLDGVVRPLGEHLAGLQAQVQRIHETDIRERAGLGEQLTRLHQMSDRLNTEADRLARALRGESKTRGDHGEHILEVVLQSAGLDEGIAYRTQESHRDEAGDRVRPDVIVNLPNHRALVIDAKMPLNPWSDLANAADDERDVRRAAFVAAVKRHVDGLSQVAYQRLPELQTVDFVLLFIPIEAAYLEAMRPEHRIFDHAMAKKVVLVGATTLLATLATVRHVWVQEKQRRNYAEIARTGERVVEQVERFLEHFAKVGGSLASAQGAFDDALKRLHTGRGNLLSSARRLTELGINADAVRSKAAQQLGIAEIEE